MRQEVSRDGQKERLLLLRSNNLHMIPLTSDYRYSPECRRWIDEDTPDPEAIKLADVILRAGMQQLPNNPYMILLYSSFLIDVQGSYQSGYGQLQAAKKADPRLVIELHPYHLIVSTQ